MSDAASELIITVRCATAALDDIGFRPGFIFEPLARATAKAQHPGFTVRYSGRYTRVAAADAPGFTDATTHWQLVPGADVVR
jgi:hypothetical protein